MTVNIRVAAIAALSAVVLAACSGGSESTAPPVPSKAASSSAAASTDVPAVDASASAAPVESSNPSAPSASEVPAAPASPAALDAEVAKQESDIALLVSQQLMAFASDASTKKRGVKAGTSDMQLFDFLAKDPDSWALAAKQLGVEAENRQVKITVDGADLSKVTAQSLKLDDGLDIVVASDKSQCKVKAVFISGSVTAMAWEGPTCTAPDKAPASASPSAASATASASASASTQP